MFGTPGWGEMMIVGVIALLLFGKRLPEVARSLGKGLTEFKKGMQGIEDDVRDTSNGRSEASVSQVSRPAPRIEDEEKAPVEAGRFEPPTTPPTSEPKDW